MLTSPARRDLDESLATVRRLADSERCRRLDLLEHIWKGTRYEAEGRASFWDPEVPLRERAPCIVYPIARFAGRRLTTMVFGEGRFPALGYQGGATGMGPLALSDDEAALLGRITTAIVAQARLKLRMRGALMHGLMAGTAVLVAALRAGRVVVDLLSAKWCTPTFDPADAERVLALDVRYRYEAQSADGHTAHFWFRRTITDRADTTYLPAPARDDGREPRWEPDPARTFAIEFCPVVWVRNLPEPGAEDTDGTPLVEHLEDEIECLDFSLSQRHRSARYNGEPQTVLTGASLGDLQGPQGPQATTQSQPFSWADRAIDAAGRVVGRAGGSRTKKAPGTIWAIPKEGADAKLLESTGSGEQILSHDAEDIERKILKTVGVVDADPATLGSGELSARALTILFAPQIDTANDLRECWGEVLARVIACCLRLLVTDAAAKSGVFLPGAAEAIPLLHRLLLPDGRFCPPEPTLAWGSYFEPGAVEQQAAVAGMNTATGGRQVLSRATAVRALARVLPIADAQAELDAIDAEEGAGGEALRGALGALANEAPVKAAPEMPVLSQYDYEAGIVTVNEARSRKGFGPIPGGDVSVALWMARNNAMIEGAVAGAKAEAAPPPLTPPAVSPVAGLAPVSEDLADG